MTGCLLPASDLSVCLPWVNDQPRNLATSAWYLAHPACHPNTHLGLPMVFLPSQKLGVWRAQGCSGRAQGLLMGFHALSGPLRPWPALSLEMAGGAAPPDAPTQSPLPTRKLE